MLRGTVEVERTCSQDVQLDAAEARHRAVKAKALKVVQRSNSAASLLRILNEQIMFDVVGHAAQVVSFPVDP
jgi:hypothetical protein